MIEMSVLRTECAESDFYFTLFQGKVAPVIMMRNGSSFKTSIVLRAGGGVDGNVLSNYSCTLPYMLISVSRFSC